MVLYHLHNPTVGVAAAGLLLLVSGTAQCAVPDLAARSQLARCAPRLNAPHLQPPHFLHTRHPLCLPPTHLPPCHHAAGPRLLLHLQRVQQGDCQRGGLALRHLHRLRHVQRLLPQHRRAPPRAPAGGELPLPPMCASGSLCFFQFVAGVRARCMHAFMQHMLRASCLLPAPAL